MCAARRMASARPIKHQSGQEWVYPSSVNVLKKVGLLTIAEYIEDRRTIISVFIANRQIFGMCEGGVRRRGSNPD